MENYTHNKAGCFMLARYEDIVEIRSKGTDDQFGLFARKDFRVGELILKEAPICTFERGLTDNAHKLDPRYIKEIRTLQGTDLESIVYRNSFKLGVTDDSGLFLLLSRINHSCIENATTDWDETLNIMRLRSISNIKAGEEIFLNYLNEYTFGTHRERNLIFTVNYKFQCRCALC